MGTRDHLRTASAVSWDHPHAYGDKYLVGLNERTSSGSSPRVWGQVAIAGFVTGLIGIIPTRMGTSYHLPYRVILSTDHPHAYGDKNFNYNR